MMVQDQEEMGEGSEMPIDPHHTPTIIQPSTSQPQKKQRSRRPKRKDTEVPQPSGPTNNVADEAVYEEMDDRVNTPQSDEDNLKLKELMELCGQELEKKNRSKTHGLKILYKVGLSARIESSEDEGLEWVVETEVSSKRCKTLSVDEVTLAQALAALKSAKPKTDKVMLQEPEQGTITTIIAATTITAANTRPKAKGLVIHEEEQATTPTVSSQKPLQVKVQDKAEFNEEERLAREKDEANVALTKEWNDIQAKIDADYQLAQILQA
ncbi:hypothetical protein Tco_0533435 [Tanacetum coccineum]